jgi:hypothetical protein
MSGPPSGVFAGSLLVLSRSESAASRTGAHTGGPQRRERSNGVMSRASDEGPGRRGGAGASEAWVLPEAEASSEVRPLRC